MTARTFTSPATVAITGATGFLGSHLAHALHGRGHRLVILKRSTSDVRRIAPLLAVARTWDIDLVPVSHAFAAQPVDCVLHCATDYGRGPGTLAAVVETNVAMPVRLLEAAVMHGVPFFVNVDTLLDGHVTGYALAKRQAREWIDRFAESLGVIHVALSTFYGSGDDPEKIVSSLVRRAVAGERRIELTPGEQERDFIHVDDAVAAFLAIFDELGRPGCGTAAAGAPRAVRYEVGSGQPVSIRDLAEMIRRLSGRADLQLHFGALPYRTGEVMRVCADSGSLRRLGWKPRIGLEEGLSRTLREETAWASQCGEVR